MKPIHLDAIATLLDVIDHAPKDAEFHIRVAHDRNKDGWPDAPITFQYVDHQGSEVDKEHFAQLLVGGAIAPKVVGRELQYLVTEYGYTLYHRMK